MPTTDGDAAIMRSMPAGTRVRHRSRPEYGVGVVARPIEYGQIPVDFPGRAEGPRLFCYPINLIREDR